MPDKENGLRCIVLVHLKASTGSLARVGSLSNNNETSTVISTGVDHDVEMATTEEGFSKAVNTDSMMIHSKISLAGSIGKGTVKVKEIMLGCSDGMKVAAQHWSHNPLNNESIHYLDGIHQTEKRRILCLHGFVDNCRSFYALAPYLISRLPNYELVALDFPGHGLSSSTSADHPPRITTISEFAYYVFEAVSALEWGVERPFSIIGHSLGGAVGVYYAATFGDHVEKLINLDGFGPEGFGVTKMTRSARRHMTERREGNIKYFQQKKPPIIYHNLRAAVETRQRTATNSPGNQWLSEKAAVEMVSRAVENANGGREGTSGVQFRHDPRLHWTPLQFHTWPQAEQFFIELKCPYIWFRAEHGWPFSQDIVDRVKKVRTPELYRILPGSHHFHADPETTGQVSQAVLDALISDFPLRQSS